MTEDHDEYFVAYFQCSRRDISSNGFGDS